MYVENNTMSFTNNNACLKLHREAFKSQLQDFIISFKQEHTTIEEVLQITSDLFDQLIKSYDKPLQARLVAKIKFIHINETAKEIEERSYHFTSYQYEHVLNTNEFYQRHMQKIASRLDSFNRNGSNLMIKNIEHVHICLKR